jgi:hypothetical protein
MTRKGKIARLPRTIRDELNQRLDDGEQGVRLVEWLNGLPEVKKVLESDFEGRAITDGNLADWKNGGFLDWQAQQETLTLVQELKADGKELAAMSAGELAESTATVTMARFAAALYRSNGGMSEEQRSQLRGLGAALRDVVKLRRSEQAQERMQIEREWLELERRKTDEGQRKKFLEWTKDPKIRQKLTPKMTEEEKDAVLAEILGIKGEEKAKYLKRTADEREAKRKRQEKEDEDKIF